MGMKRTRKLPRSHQKHKKLEHRRLQAAKLFENQTTQAEIARRLGVSREAVRQWYEIWRQRGIEGLRSKGHPGQKAKLSAIQKEEIERILLEGPIAAGYATDIWTLERISRVIKKVAAIRYHPGHVWHLLTNMGWSCQKPKTRPKERRAKAIRHWRQHTWSRIKKSPKIRPKPWLSRRDRPFGTTDGSSHLGTKRQNPGHSFNRELEKPLGDRRDFMLCFGPRSEAVHAHF